MEPDDPAVRPGHDGSGQAAGPNDRQATFEGNDRALLEEAEPVDERTELERFIATRMLGRPGEGKHERIGKVTLRLLTGPHADLVVAFTGDRIEGGRGPANDLVLNDSAVSQSHFELVLGQQRLRLRDLGSTNGTWIGPVRVQDVELPVKAVFTVGKTDIEISAVERMRVPASRVDQFGHVRAKSPIMRELFVLLERLASTELDILLQGEPGTGKRIIAEAIHRRSRRSKGPLVFYDCALERDSAIVEETLFPSAGTSALLQQAAGGTLVFRRIEDLPIRLQAKLLEFLLARDAARESKGPSNSKDVRFIFLSTLDLRTLSSAGLFFESLHQKIAEVSLRIPPLRERKGDPVFLLQHFLVDFSPKQFFDLSRDAQRGLSLYSFPGNVRELQGVALRAIDSVSGPKITRRDLRLGDRDGLDGVESLTRLEFRTAKDRLAQRYFAILSRETEGNLPEIVRRSGVSVSTIRRMLPHLFRERPATVRSRRGNSE